jgi:hypothetical protein
MDFVVLAGLAGTILHLLVFSYDIVCQWSRKFKKQKSQLLPHMRLSREQIDRATYRLPKFHIANHRLSCQVKYSPNYLKYSAHTNGEDPKCFWAHMNLVSMSTREMGGGSCEDALDDHTQSWNFRKIVGFGDCFIYFNLVPLLIQNIG